MLILVSLILVVAGMSYWIWKGRNDQTQPEEDMDLLNCKVEDYWQQLLMAMQELSQQKNPTAEVRILQDSLKDVEALGKVKPGKIVLMLLGEFSAGKSSFINALLDDDVLTTKIRPTTASVTILSYGEEEKAIIHEVGGQTKILPLDEQRKNITQITAMGKHQENAEELQKIEYVELFLRCDLLKEMEIIDTPGFNSGYEWHTVSTKKFLQRADVILWMFHATKAGTRTEYELLQQTDSQHKIAIVNQIDRINQEDREDAFAHIRGEIPLELFEKVFFVSSKKPKEGEDAEDYQRICELRQYFVQEIVPQKKKYVADHKRQFLKGLLQTTQKAEQKLNQDCYQRSSEMHSLMMQCKMLMQQSEERMNAMHHFQKYQQEPKLLLQHLEQVLVQEFWVSGMQATVQELRTALSRLLRDQQNIVELERVEASKHQTYNASVEKYEPLKKEYDNSFFSNIADSVWNFVANSNFTNAKDELDKAEQEMQEAERCWQQAKRKTQDARQHYESGKAVFDASCDSFAQNVRKQANRQQQSILECQRKAEKLQQQHEQQKLKLQHREKMLQSIRNVQQAADSIVTCCASQEQTEKALLSA